MKRNIREPKQERSQTTVNSILVACRELVYRGGFTSLTTNAIAKRAGVSIGSLYQYFPNRNTIIQSLINLFYHGIADEFHQRVKSIPRDNPQQIAASLIDAIVDYITPHARMLSPWVTHVPTSVRIRITEESAQPVLEIMTKLLVDHPQWVRPLEPSKVAFLIFHALEGMLFSILAQHPEWFDEDQSAWLKEELTQLLLGYLTPQAGAT